MSKYSKLKEKVYKANIDLVRHNLVILTWGNVSGIDREEGVIAIKPSGVDYAEMTPDQIVIVDMEGNKVEGDLNPSSDLATHIELYNASEKIGGITHTHSFYATAFSQACKEIPCLGTTHADHFYGQIPVTRQMTDEEIKTDYEKNTGKVIVERFEDFDMDMMPAILVANHGPFTWGKDAESSVNNAVVLESTAQMSLTTLQINPDIFQIPNSLLDKHFLRKHGPNAYYGQK